MLVLLTVVNSPQLNSFLLVVAFRMFFQSPHLNDNDQIRMQIVIAVSLSVRDCFEAETLRVSTRLDVL